MCIASTKFLDTFGCFLVVFGGAVSYIHIGFCREREGDVWDGRGRRIRNSRRPLVEGYDAFANSEG